MKTLSVLLSKTFRCTPPPLQSDHPLFQLYCYLFSHLSPISGQIRFHGLWQYKLTHNSDLQIRKSGVRTETLRGALDSNSDLRQSSKELDEEWGCSMSLRQRSRGQQSRKLGVDHHQVWNFPVDIHGMTHVCHIGSENFKDNFFLSWQFYYKRKTWSQANQKSYSIEKQGDFPACPVAKTPNS